MKSSYPLTDYEAHIVRERPEYDWTEEQRAEAEARDRLPIDLPAVEDDGLRVELVGVYDIEFGIAVVLLVTFALWVLL